MANMRLIGGIIAGVAAGIASGACAVYEAKREKRRNEQTVKFLSACDDLMDDTAKEFSSGKFDKRPLNEKMEVLSAFIERTKVIDEEAGKLDSRDSWKTVKIKAIMVDLRSKLHQCEGELRLEADMQGSGT